MLIQVKIVQTYLAHKVANYLSERLKTKVEIESVDFQFFKNFVFQNVYVEDLHHDTLVFAKKIKIGIDKINFNKHILHIGDLILLNTNSKIIKYKADDKYNFQFILDSFKSSDTTATTPNWDFELRGMTLINSAFIYRSEHDTFQTSGINYFDINTQHINAQFTDIQFEKDTIHATIDYLSGKEKCGFALENLSCYLNINPVGIKLDELKIKTPESIIATDLTLKYSSYSDFKEFINKVTFNANFDKSHLQISDVAYFAPQLNGLYRNLIVSGKVTGKINDLRGKDVEFYLGGVSRFTGDIALTGLPHIDETMIYLNVKKLSTNYGDLCDLPIPPFEEKKKMKIPVEFAKLGNMKFSGTFTGLYNDFYAYGDFISALGKISTDISVRHDVEKKKQFYKGKLKTSEFDFGKFFAINKLGKASINLMVDGSGVTPSDVNASLDGNIGTLEYNNYTYKNINTKGTIAKQIYKGVLTVADENLDFEFNGKVDFSGKLPHLDFISTLNKMDLAQLHFLKSNENTNLSTQIIIDVKGNNIDNLIGQINFDNTIFKQGNETYKLSVFNLESNEFDNKKTIKLNSDFLNAKIEGAFKVLDLPSSMTDLLSKYFPSYFSNYQTKKSTIQNFDYSIQLKKTNDFTRLFMPDIKIASGTFLNGRINTLTNELAGTGGSDKIEFQKLNFQKLKIEAQTDNTLKLNFTCENFFTSDSIVLKNFEFTSDSKNDSINITTAWDNKLDSNLFKGDIRACAKIKSAKEIDFKIGASNFVLSDSVWNINKENLLTIDSNYVNVHHLFFEHNNQSIELNGIVSEFPKDQLKFSLSNFNLSNLNPLTRKSGINFKGTINGESIVTDFYNNMLFTSQNKFKSFYINNNEVGDGAIESEWDKSKEAINLKGSFSLGIVPNIIFSGYYFPKKQKENIDMKLNMQAVQMQLLEPFIKKYCSRFRGLVEGNIDVKGSIDKPLLSGQLNVNAKEIAVDYLKTSYKFSHQINIDQNSMGIDNLKLFDVNGNAATVTGKVYHDNFKNFQLDFDISSDKFLCLNTTENDNSSYYGTAYISGITSVFGFTDNIQIDANVKTDKIIQKTKDKFNPLSKTDNTKFFIPLSKTSEVNENNFIKFIKKDSEIKLTNDYKVSVGGLTMNFNLEVTPDAEVQLIFDQKVGDVIKARGNGNIILKINSQGDFKMFGDYVIENGDYLFTLQNIINKKFELEKGGNIKWSGVPYQAEMNLSAIYNARASLKPFFPEDSTGIYKKRHPVDLKLLMTGELLSPEIHFDIGLPTIDASTRQTVLSYINSDAELNRQVFSLLILGSFVTPYQLTNTGEGANVGSAASANTSELLSNQLSSMLSSISKDFDVGINYRPGDAVTKEEVGLALSTQLFDDKLSIDGNVGVNNNNSNANNVIGDINVEYKITTDGKLRVKAFNKANDFSGTQTTSNGLYTQGVGIFYREEFDTLGELFRRYLKTVTPKKKEKLPE